MEIRKPTFNVIDFSQKIVPLCKLSKNIPMGKHKNLNDAIGNFCIYQILIDNKIYKVGKTDFDRITKSTDMPTRIHQQIRILHKTYEPILVRHRIMEVLFGVSTLDAKRLEKKVLLMVYEDMKEIPKDNQKSFKLSCSILL